MTITDKLVEALRNLRALYDTDEGCRSAPEYIAATEALAAYASQQAEPSDALPSDKELLDWMQSQGQLSICRARTISDPTPFWTVENGYDDDLTEFAEPEDRRTLRAALRESMAWQQPESHDADDE